MYLEILMTSALIFNAGSGKITPLTITFPDKDGTARSGVPAFIAGRTSSEGKQTYSVMT
jgi:hypothetical protein